MGASRPDDRFLVLVLLFLIGFSGRAEAVGDLVAPGRHEGFVVFVIATVVAAGGRKGKGLGAEWREESVLFSFVVLSGPSCGRWRVGGTEEGLGV